MPRRKKHIIDVSQLPCYDTVVAALRNLPELASGSDASTLQLVVTEPITPKIKDIDAVIDHFTRYLSANKKFIKLVDDEQIITREQLAKMLGISRQTLTDWIKKGFITPQRHKSIPDLETFNTDTVLEQLKRYKSGEIEKER
jgi:DNA-binding XRE family transcriptional regulator